MNRVKFLDHPVDSVSIPEALNWMEECIESGEPHSIAVVNANKYWLMSKDKRLRDYVRRSDLVIPEWAVVWGAARLKLPLRTYVRGVALLQAAIPWAEEKGFRPYFLGASPEVCATLETNLRKNFPRLEIAGCHHGYIQSIDAQAEVVRDIQMARPDMLFVAMGSPRQEYWIKDNLETIRVPVAMGVGGSFDVIAGLKKDTPRWVQGTGLEWVYRVSQDPKAYWKRYLVTNTWFVFQVLKAAYIDRRITN